LEWHFNSTRELLDLEGLPGQTPLHATKMHDLKE